MKLILKNERVIASHTDDQNVISFYGEGATEILVPDDTEIDPINGTHNAATEDIKEVPKVYQQLDILMKLESMGKADAVIEEMTIKEQMLWNSATKLQTDQPEYILVQNFIDRAKSKGILNQEQVDEILA